MKGSKIASPRLDGLYPTLRRHKVFLVSRAILSLVVAIGTFFALAAPAAADPRETQMDYQAGFRADVIPTSDPCLVAFASATVSDIIRTTEPWTDSISFYFGLNNVCGEHPTTLFEYVGSAPELAETDFTVSPSLQSASLAVTATAFDNVAQLVAPVTLSLSWTSLPGAGRDQAAVTGTLSSPDLTVTLDQSLVWNDWASIQDPDTQPPLTIAGLWFCNFRVFPTPGCIGQGR